MIAKDSCGTHSVQAGRTSDSTCAVVLSAEVCLVADARAEHLRLPGLGILAEVLGDWRPPRGTGRVIVQSHCHQSAELAIEPERDLSLRTGLDVEILEPSCCGLAGNFGFEAGHYEVSIATGARAEA